MGSGHRHGAGRHHAQGSARSRLRHHPWPLHRGTAPGRVQPRSRRPPERLGPGQAPGLHRPRPVHHHAAGWLTPHLRRFAAAPRVSRAPSALARPRARGGEWALLPSQPTANGRGIRCHRSRSRRREGTQVEPLPYLALNGSLGTGFREESLEAGLTRPLAFIGVDSGSTDGGPYYLGSGAWIWSMEAYERDLGLGLRGAHRIGVPLIVGSCGGGGNDSAVEGYLAMVDRLASAAGFSVRVACVATEPDRELLVRKYRQGDLRPLPGAPAIDEATLRQPGHIVAMAGAEPIQDALDLGADVVLLGRCADAAIFAAMPIARGFDPGPVWNAAKIVECGSAAATNRKGQDSILCTIEDDGFVLEPLDPDLRCTPASVAAHTLYETADPYRLIMPSGVLDARTATYEALDERRVKVRGGTFSNAETYTAK